VVDSFQSSIFLEKNKSFLK
jgi:hypothetical protein